MDNALYFCVSIDEKDMKPKRELTVKKIQKWLDDPNSQFTASKTSILIGFSSAYLPLILEGKKPLTDSVIKKLLPYMRKYGYQK